MKYLKINKKYLIHGITFLLIISPLLINLVRYYDNANFIENLFQFDLNRYFTNIITDNSLFVSGKYSVFSLGYWFLFLLQYGLSIIFSPLISFFIVMLLFYLLGFIYFIKFFEIIGSEQNRDSFLRQALISIFALIFFSSLSFFIYIKGSFLPSFSYLIFFPILYYATKFMREGRRQFIWPLATFFLINVASNITYFAISFLATVFLQLIFTPPKKKQTRAWLMRISVLTASALPAFIAIVSFVIFGAGYGGDVGSASKVFAENFYSDNTNYLNIIKQVTDWAFFDSWKGLPFYSYSSVYANNLFSILAFSPYFLILYLLYKSRNNRGHRSTKALYLVAAGLFVFQLMLGLNNPFYKFFYQHSSAFQIFRNITKFAPLLLLMLLMAIYLLMVEMRSNRKIMIFSSVLLFLTLCYNLPYWVYSNDFYQKRIVKDIPDYWIEASTFLDTEAIPGSKALILPPTYISDTYLWNEKSNDVRGSLFDAIAETKTYRLSETMVGSAEFQVDSYNLFVRDYINPRKKKVDYNRLGDFLTKYNLNWVIITEDLLNEYQDEQDLAKWLSVQGYKIKGEFGKIALYENDKNYKPQISSNSIRYKKISNTSYLLNVSLTDSAEITFDQPANPDWQLKILPQEELDCKSWIALPDGTDKNSYCVDSRAGNNLLESIVRNRMSKHLVEQQSSMDDRIAWRVDTQEIIEKFAPEFYNSTDSGTEVTLLLVLKTQTTFWRGLFACSVIYVLCIVYSFYPIRNKQL